MPTVLPKGGDKTLASDGWRAAGSECGESLGDVCQGRTCDPQKAESKRSHEQCLGRTVT